VEFQPTRKRAARARRCYAEAMRIGLLGGAFDPPHNAHLEIARRVLRDRALERVDLLVSNQSPHARGKQSAASLKHRLAMARLAVAGENGLGVEDCEARRPGKSYTVDTLRELRARQPADEFFFIVGGDMLADLPDWKEAREALALAEFVPVFRPGFEAGVLERLSPRLGDETVRRLRANVVHLPLMQISSSAIRAAVASGESISHWVPQAVEAYIRAWHLYSPTES
jgi:nicotinate-nucleotide adenylyltransferase